MAFFADERRKRDRQERRQSVASGLPSQPQSARTNSARYGGRQCTYGLCIMAASIPDWGKTMRGWPNLSLLGICCGLTVCLTGLPVQAQTLTGAHTLALKSGESTEVGV